MSASLYGMAAREAQYKQLLWTQGKAAADSWLQQHQSGLGQVRSIWGGTVQPLNTAPIVQHWQQNGPVAPAGASPNGSWPSNMGYMDRYKNNTPVWLRPGQTLFHTASPEPGEQPLTGPGGVFPNHTTIHPSTSPATGGAVSNYNSANNPNNPLPHYQGLEQKALEGQSAVEQHLAAMQGLYGQQGQHYDAMTALANQQKAIIKNASAQQAKQAKLQAQQNHLQMRQGQRQQLIGNRDQAQAQRAAPRSGTNHFFGF